MMYKRTFQSRTLRPIFDLLKQTREKEINSKWFLRLITAIGFIQFVWTSIISPIPDNLVAADVPLLSDSTILKIINWSDYLQLSSVFLTTNASKLYLSVTIQFTMACSFLLLVLTSNPNRIQSSFYKTLLELQGIYQQMYFPVFFIPEFKICLNALINDRTALPATILGGIFVFWPFLYSSLVEMRFSLHTDFFVVNHNYKNFGSFSVLFILAKAVLVIANRVLADGSSSYSTRAGIMYGFSLVTAAILIVAYFREMSFCRRSFASFFLVCMTSWMTLSTFVYLKLYQGINDLVYIAGMIGLVLGYTIYKIHMWWTDYLVFKSEPHKLSDALFSFLTKELFQLYQEAEAGHMPSKFYIVNFIERYILVSYPKLSQEIAYKSEILERRDRYDIFQRSDSREKTKDPFTLNLKILLFTILDHIFKKRLSMSQKKKTQNFNLIIEYASFVIASEKSGIKASKILATNLKTSFTETLPPLNQYLLITLQAEISSIVEKKQNYPKVQGINFSAAMKFESDLKTTKELLLDTIQKHEDFFSLLIQKSMDLDRIYRGGHTLFHQKEKLEKLYRELFKLNEYSEEALSLYYLYNRLDIAVDRIEEIKIIERKVFEQHALNDELLFGESIHKLNVFTKGTGIIFTSLHDRPFEKVLACTSGIYKIFGYDEIDLKSRQLSVLMPSCIVESHQEIAISSIFSSKRLPGPKLLPAVNKQRFLVPTSLVVNLEPYGQEICAAGIFSQRVVPFEWLIINKFGHLLNYTEAFHEKLNLSTSEDKRPLYGFNIATLIPSLVDYFYGEFMNLNSAEGEIEEAYKAKESFGVSCFNQQRSSETVASKNYDTYFFLPDVKSRAQELEHSIKIIERLFNPLAATGNLKLENYQLLELFHDSTGPLIDRTNIHNLHLFRISFSIDTYERESSEGFCLKYYNLRVHSLVLEQRRNIISRELTNYHGLLRRVRSVLENYEIKMGTQRKWTKNIKHMETAVSHSKAEQNRLVLTESPMEEHELMKQETIELNIDEVRNSKYPAAYNSLPHTISDSEEVPNESISDDLELKAKFFEPLDLDPHPKRPIKANINYQYGLDNLLDQPEEDEEVKEVHAILQIGHLKPKNQSENKEVSLRGINIHEEARELEENPNLPLRLQEQQPSLKGKLLRGQINSSHSNDGKELKFNMVLAAAGPHTSNSQLYSSNEVKGESKDSGCKGSEKSEENKTALKSSFKRQAQKGQESLASTNYSKNARILELKRVILDHSTPRILSKFNKFGMAAFGVLTLLIILLFFFLNQLLTAYKGYVAITDCPSYLLTPYTFFFLEAERLIMINNGYSINTGIHL